MIESTLRGSDPATGPHPDAVPLAWPDLAILGAALALGVLLRFFTTSSLWLDEALSVNIASLPLSDLVEALRHDGHPPLYYALLHGWMKLFGDGDVAVRALSGVFSLATLPFIGVLAYRRRGMVTGVTAAALASVVPYAARYATEARMYALVMLLVAVGWFLVDRLLDDEAGWGATLALGLVGALLLYSHYWSIWLLGVTGLGLLLVWWRSKDQRRRTGARRGALALVGSAVLFVPWLPVMLDQLAHTGTPWGQPQRPSASIALTLGDMAGTSLVPEAIAGALILVGLLLLSLMAVPKPPFQIVLDLRTVPGIRVELAVAGLALFLGLIVALLSGSTFATRYAAITFPILAVASGMGLSAMPLPWIRALATVGAITIFGATSLLGAVDQRTQGADAAQAVAAGYESGDVVLVCPDQLGPAFARALPQDIPVFTYPSLDSPEFVDWRDYQQRNEAADPSLIADEIRGRSNGNAIWMVWLGGYKTYENQCEEVRNQLAAGQVVSVALTPALGEVFEPMWVERISPSESLSGT